MSSLSELLKEKNTLPSGNVYIKNINGHSYYYYQFFHDGKRYTRKIDKSYADELYLQIKRRKEIEILINELRSRDKNVTLSNAAKTLTGYLMSENNVVAEFDHGQLVSMNEKLVPLIIKRTHSLEKFLSLRVMDMSRTNARLLKRTLDIQVDEEYKIPLFAYALSISDSYWFKPKHSKIKYVDIKPNNDNYFETALKGDTTVFPRQTKLTPEITTTGSFEKGWKLIDNTWWLYKSGNNKQLFSEMFCYYFANLLEIPTATYELEGKYIKSQNFADKYNFEPIASLADNNDNYDYIFNILLGISKDIAKQYIKLIFFDSVVYNIDRHNENIGLLRNKKTGKIVSLAPNFDNNLALISSVDSLKEPNHDSFIYFFIDFIEKNQVAKELFKQIPLKMITFYEIREIIDKIPIEIDDKGDLVAKIYYRYYFLKEHF